MPVRGIDCVERVLQVPPALLACVEVVLLHTAVQFRGIDSVVCDGSKKNSIAGSDGLLELYDITNRIKGHSKDDDKGGSKPYPSRTSYGQRWEIAQKHGIDTGPLKFLGIPISGMMYYMNWVLTNAQIELITADVSVVDYNYGKKNRKRKRGEYDNRSADSKSVRKAGEQWLQRYGDKKDAGQGLSVGDILGSGMKTGVGVKMD